MIRKLLLSTAFATLATASMAADLSSRREAPLAPYVAAPVFTWTGFYVGLNAGWGWQDDTTRFSNIAAPYFNLNQFLTTKLEPKGNGFLGGATAGYNVQSGSTVWGIEGDFDGLNGKATGSVAYPANFFNFGDPPMTVAAKVTTNWLATVRGRFGVLVSPQALLYGTGGLAIGQVQASSAFTPGGSSNCTNNVYCSVGSASSTQIGWTLGAGLEYGFAPGWSGKVEGLYYDLGSFNYGIKEGSTSAGAFIGTPQATAKAAATGEIVRIGLNYRFGAPATAVGASY